MSMRLSSIVYQHSLAYMVTLFFDVLLLVFQGLFDLFAEVGIRMGLTELELLFIEGLDLLTFVAGDADHVIVHIHSACRFQQLAVDDYQKSETELHS